MTHCITNPVTVNCANIILAAGGTAIMAQDEREVEEITAHASLRSQHGRGARAGSHAARGSKLQKLGHPVVLSPVAAVRAICAMICARSFSRKALSQSFAATCLKSVRWPVGPGARRRRCRGRPLGGRLGDEGQSCGIRSLAARFCASYRYGRTADRCDGRDLNQTHPQCCYLGGSELLRRITGAGCMLTSLAGVLLRRCADRLFDRGHLGIG